MTHRHVFLCHSLTGLCEYTNLIKEGILVEKRKLHYCVKIMVYYCSVLSLTHFFTDLSTQTIHVLWHDPEDTLPLPFFCRNTYLSPINNKRPLNSICTFVIFIRLRDKYNRPTYMCTCMSLNRKESGWPSFSRLRTFLYWHPSTCFTLVLYLILTLDRILRLERVCFKSGRSSSGVFSQVRFYQYSRFKVQSIDFH